MVLTLGCKLGYWTFAITKKTRLMPCVSTSEVTLKLFQENYLRLNIPFQCWIVSWWIGPNIFFREIKVMRIKHSNLEYCKASKKDFMKRAMELIRKRFYRRQMNNYIKEFVGKICKCTNGRRWITLAQAPQTCIASATPMEQVGTDFIHLDTLIGVSQYLLLIADHFTRYNQVYPIVKKDAKVLACDLECQEWTNEPIYHLDTKKLRKEVTWKNYIHRRLQTYN